MNKLERKWCSFEQVSLLAFSWRGRAQQCRDEARKAHDESEREEEQRLLSRAKAIDACAQELENAVGIKPIIQ